jgi:hypothetical protein
MKLVCCLASLSIALLISCGTTPVPPKSNPPNQPPATAKVEPTKATLTPGMEAAKKAQDEGRYAEAVRLYTAELAAEEAKPACSCPT